MKPPKCKLCGKAHWTYEEHAGSETEVPDYVREMASGTMGLHQGPPSQLPGPVVSPQEPRVPTNLSPLGARGEGMSPQCECGKPRDGRHGSCAACRKRAYRERSK